MPKRKPKTLKMKLPEPPAPSISKLIGNLITALNKWRKPVADLASMGTIIAVATVGWINHRGLKDVAVKASETQVDTKKLVEDRGIPQSPNAVHEAVKQLAEAKDK